MSLIRESRTFTARFERWALPRLAASMPRWVKPDRLTALALAAALGGGVAYWRAGHHLAWLHLASLALVVHWFGDSLDGTLARVRGIGRERYGHFVDHSADAVAAWCLLGGIAASGLVRPWIALVVLGAFLVHMLHAAQVGIARGRFVLAPIGRVGPTELRLGLIGVNTALWASGNPQVAPGWTLFDGFLGVGAALLLFSWLVVLARETVSLSREDPTPEPRLPDAPSPREGPGRTTASRPARGPDGSA